MVERSRVPASRWARRAFNQSKPSPLHVVLGERIMKRGCQPAMSSDLNQDPIERYLCETAGVNEGIDKCSNASKNNCKAISYLEGCRARVHLHDTYHEILVVHVSSALIRARGSFIKIPRHFATLSRDNAMTLISKGERNVMTSQTDFHDATQDNRRRGLCSSFSYICEVNVLY